MPPRTRRVALLLLCLIVLANFGSGVIHELVRNRDYTVSDQSAYLLLSMYIRNGVCLTDGNRHPLFPFLLTTVSGEDTAFFCRAKVVSAVLAAGVLLVMLRTACRAAGTRAGFLAVFLLSVNGLFHRMSGTVNCEAMLALFLFLAWHTIGFRSAPTRRDYLLGGVYTGLAYLTKGTGLLFLIAVIVYETWRARQTGKARLLRSLAFLTAGFVLVAWPLLSWNTYKFQNPLYNGNTKHVFWADRWEDVWVSDPADLPSLQKYVQTHTLEDMARRLGTGVGVATGNYVSSLRPSFVSALTPWQSAAFGALLLIALFHLLAKRGYGTIPRRAVGLALVYGGLSLLFLGWYAQVVSGERFFLPLALPTFLILACGLLPQVRGPAGASLSPIRTGRPVNYLVAGLVTFTSIANLVAVSLPPIEADPSVCARFPGTPEESALDRWLRSEDKGGVHMILGDLRQPVPVWNYWRHNIFVQIPTACKGLDEMPACLPAGSNRFLLFDMQACPEEHEEQPGLSVPGFLCKDASLPAVAPPGLQPVDLGVPPGGRYALFRVTEPLHPDRAGSAMRPRALPGDTDS